MRAPAPVEHLLAVRILTHLISHVDAVLRIRMPTNPPKDVLVILSCKPREERNWHAMYVSTWAILWPVQIRMRIDPNHRHVPTQPLLDSLGRPADGPDCNRVVSAQREHHASLTGMLVDLLGQLARYGRDGAWILHATVRLVRGWVEIRIGVYGAIMMHGVGKLALKLGEEACVKERLWAFFDAEFDLKMPFCQYRASVRDL